MNYNLREMAKKGVIGPYKQATAVYETHPDYVVQHADTEQFCQYFNLQLDQGKWSVENFGSKTIANERDSEKAFKCFKRI